MQFFFRFYSSFYIFIKKKEKLIIIIKKKITNINKSLFYYIVSHLLRLSLSLSVMYSIATWFVCSFVFVWWKEISKINKEEERKIYHISHCNLKSVLYNYFDSFLFFSSSYSSFSMYIYEYTYNLWWIYRLSDTLARRFSLLIIWALERARVYSSLFFFMLIYLKKKRRVVLLFTNHLLCY